MSIPARVHFCWIGARLPWAYVFAILSAAERSGLPEIILHHTDVLDDRAELSALKATAGVTLHRIDPIACLTETGDTLGVGNRLAALYGGIASPVMRTDILRAAILFQQGGIYLDLDTVTVASLLPLLDAAQFVGCEYIVWPHLVRKSRSPLRWARSLTLDLLRKAMRRRTDGWKGFRQVERFYYRGLNNAVMGAEPNSPLFARYLRAMLTVTPERLLEAYALGPDLLQDVVGEDRPDDLVIHDPAVFYPLPPEISEHWFRSSENVQLDAVLSTETRVVHWYASVRTKSRVAQIDPAYIAEHRKYQLYSALVWSCLSNLPETA
jgi:Glycosyltransferase sugar-binding region containing DXD motif